MTNEVTTTKQTSVSNVDISPVINEMKHSGELVTPRLTRHKSDVKKQKAYAEFKKNTHLRTLSKETNLTMSGDYKKLVSINMKMEFNEFKRYIMIPDLKLLNKETIVDSLYNLGLNIKFFYSNQGFRQVPLPGDSLAPKDTVYVYLDDSE